MQKLLGVAVAGGVLAVGFGVRKAHYRATPHVSREAPRRPSPMPLGFDLVDDSARSGISHKHEGLQAADSLKKVKPFLMALAGASVAVADFDGDGRPDVYFTNAGKGSLNRLYRNKGDGTFEEIAGRVGLADLNREAASLRALAFDFDNDGRVDVFLSTTYCPKLLRQGPDGRFTDVTKASGIAHCGYSHASNAADLDGDGRLDLVVADYYGDVDLWAPKTKKFMFNKIVGADNGGPINVYLNRGGFKFERVPDALGIKSRGWTHAVGVYDLRGTGKPDLHFATDFNLDQLYYSEGGRYRDASGLFGRKYQHFGMSSEIARLDDAAPSVYVTDMHDPGRTLASNTLWRFEEGRPTNAAAKAGVAQCGWSWGAKFADFDDDGRLDLAVTNGMLSADPNQDYWFKLGTLHSATRRFWEDADLWPGFGKASWAGYQTKCLFLREGEGFRDVSDDTGFGRDESDGRGLAAIDVRSDGSIGLVQAAMNQQARLFRNERRNAFNWIGFKLEGTRSNRDAVGAQVAVSAGGRTYVRDLYPANGFQSQSDGRLHFGLGEARVVDRVVVRWPSGLAQELKGLAPGRYHRIVEPK